MSTLCRGAGLWRGVLFDWLRGFMGPVAAILVQAASFGAAHYSGVPSGWAGVGLATLYGVMLGWLSWRAEGLLAAIVAHVAADLVIFSLAAVALRG
ncbi:hypothetical protein COC42_13935 [Sphingomonas spermidinifaciens]|uniref:CAAX prenyl protease 2/Lysostaphin resistance protein A-like domain-containing protein n=1 Tax=Sphingomonas spermidinifaciens TaxID=1141889 RepID=A0A2A4B236_9SPHN|nr:CPBP family intramembrane glutamic endopeptidase [Sphingomonas spermidinifaciens]PCD02511.1 hypothetical protein COC42_13935 [Sphingomonas spermidinifaciens]